MQPPKHACAHSNKQRNEKASLRAFLLYGPLTDPTVDWPPPPKPNHYPLSKKEERAKPHPKTIKNLPNPREAQKEGKKEKRKEPKELAPLIRKEPLSYRVNGILVMGRKRKEEREGKKEKPRPSSSGKRDAPCGLWGFYLFWVFHLPSAI